MLVTCPVELVSEAVPATRNVVGTRPQAGCSRLLYGDLKAFRSSIRQLTKTQRPRHSRKRALKFLSVPEESLGLGDKRHLGRVSGRAGLDMLALPNPVDLGSDLVGPRRQLQVQQRTVADRRKVLLLI